MTTLDPVKAAKALVMLGKGWRVEWWGRLRAFVASDLTTEKKDLVVASTPIDALAAAYDALHPGETPDVVVVPRKDADEAAKRITELEMALRSIADSDVASIPSETLLHTYDECESCAAKIATASAALLGKGD